MHIHQEKSEARSMPREHAPFAKGPVLVYYTVYPIFLKFHEFNRNSYDHVAEVLLVHNC